MSEEKHRPWRLADDKETNNCIDCKKDFPAKTKKKLRCDPCNDIKAKARKKIQNRRAHQRRKEAAAART